MDLPSSTSCGSSLFLVDRGEVAEAGAEVIRGERRNSSGGAGDRRGGRGVFNRDVAAGEGAGGGEGLDAEGETGAGVPRRDGAGEGEWPRGDRRNCSARAGDRRAGLGRCGS